MIPLLTRLRFYLYSHATDMRKSFDGLAGIVTSALARDPTSDDVYIFLNRRRDRMKLLLWDRTGFWLFYKRLGIHSVNHVFPSGDALCIFAQHSPGGIPCCFADRG